MIKRKTLAQKKKRPTSHRVGNRLDFSKKKNLFPPIDPLASPSITIKEGTLKADKEYKRLRKHVVVGYLMILFAGFYTVFCLGVLIFRWIQLELHALIDLSETVKELGTFGLYKSQLHITDDLAYMKTLGTVVLNPVYLATAVFAILVGDTLKTNATKEIEEFRKAQIK